MEWNGMEWNGMEWNGNEWNWMGWVGKGWDGKFNQIISIKNMNEDVVHLCNRAIAMRVKQEWETRS